MDATGGGNASRQMAMSFGWTLDLENLRAHR
jgi:hypothetical protein